jgi:hypothetical protein
MRWRRGDEVDVEAMMYLTVGALVLRKDQKDWGQVYKAGPVLLVIDWHHYGPQITTRERGTEEVVVIEDDSNLEMVESHCACIRADKPQLTWRRR